MRNFRIFQLSIVAAAKRDPGHQAGVSCPKLPMSQKLTIGMIRIATMFATLIIGLIAGPAVSL